MCLDVFECVCAIAKHIRTHANTSNQNIIAIVPTIDIDHGRRRRRPQACNHGQWMDHGPWPPPPPIGFLFDMQRWWRRQAAGGGTIRQAASSLIEWNY
jgi:hypothetical protein